jgi:hypothetical protein
MVDKGYVTVKYSKKIYYIRNTTFVNEGWYNYAEIKEKNKVINNEILKEFAKRTYKPKKMVDLNSPDWEKDMEEHISIYE